MLSKWTPVLESDTDEALQSPSFQPQIMCVSTGSPSLVFDDSVEAHLGYRYLGMQAASVVRQEVSSSYCVDR